MPNHRSLKRALLIACALALALPAAARAGNLTSDANLGPSPGSGSDPELGIYRTPHFRIVHTLKKSSAASLGKLIESLFDRYVGACREAGFTAELPREPLEWLYFDERETFRKYAGDRLGLVLSDEGASYSARANTVLLLQSGELPPSQGSDGEMILADATRISHEVAHQLAFNTGLQTRGVLYPVWLSEGLATNFETDFTVAGGFASDNPARRRRLVAARRDARLLPLDELLTLTHPPEDEQARIDLYAQAWGMVRFLHERDPKAFRRYVYTLALRPHGRRPAEALRAELTSAFGPMSETSAAWERFVDSLATSRPTDDPKGVGDSL